MIVKNLHVILHRTKLSQLTLEPLAWNTESGWVAFESATVYDGPPTLILVVGMEYIEGEVIAYEFKQAWHIIQSCRDKECFTPRNLPIKEARKQAARNRVDKDRYYK